MNTDPTTTTEQPRRRRRTAWKLAGLGSVAALALVLSACTPSAQNAEINVVKRANDNFGYGYPSTVNCSDFQLQGGVFKGICGVPGGGSYGVNSTYESQTGEVTVFEPTTGRRFSCAIVKVPNGEWLPWPESCGRR